MSTDPIYRKVRDQQDYSGVIDVSAATADIEYYRLIGWTAATTVNVVGILIDVRGVTVGQFAGTVADTASKSIKTIAGADWNAEAVGAVIRHDNPLAYNTANDPVTNTATIEPTVARSPKWETNVNRAIGRIA